MVVEREFYLPSSDGCSRLHGMEWKPEGKIRATLQISHGMIDHIGRYRDFAVFMAERGFAVCGHDHLGHGKTAAKSEQLGSFGASGGSVCVIRDIRRLYLYEKRRYRDVPHFLLGHSMGSFFVRRYISSGADAPDGVILLGTGGQPEAIVLLGYMLSLCACRLFGAQFRSRILYALSVGSYNRKFYPAKTRHDWLSRDPEMVRDYESDPYCQFKFTGGAYRDLFQIILSLGSSERAGRLNRGIPVLFLSGTRDPVGGFGSGVRKIYKRYRTAGVHDLTLGLYGGARHELLNETNRLEIYEDIFRWMGERL